MRQVNISREKAGSVACAWAYDYIMQLVRALDRAGEAKGALTALVLKWRDDSEQLYDQRDRMDIYDHVKRDRLEARGNAFKTCALELSGALTATPPASVDAGTRKEEHYSKLVADMRAIKDQANEIGAGNPPDGYTELEPTETAIADACYQGGLDAMETAILNWVYDQQ